jgi:hypothetical protein
LFVFLSCGGIDARNAVIDASIGVIDASIGVIDVRAGGATHFESRERRADPEIGASIRGSTRRSAVGPVVGGAMDASIGRSTRRIG